MYAIGSRQELEALTHQLEANCRILLHAIKDGAGDVEEMAGLNLLFCSMLRDALRDHFNGKN